jgi:hypothetical protein
MTTENRSGVEKYQQEQFEKALNTRWNSVMGSDAARGREKLAQVLLCQEGDHRMSAEQIITALEKAPKPSADTGRQNGEQRQESNPALAAFDGGAPIPGSAFDPDLMAAGAKSARWLLGKSEDRHG